MMEPTPGTGPGGPDPLAYGFAKPGFPAIPGGPAHSPADMQFRRLRYFGELLAAGYRQALRPDPLPRSWRGERIALGIDLPELDTVPLWSSRRGDGSVAIPCVEFILDEARRCLDLFSRECEPGAREAREWLARCRCALDRALASARGGAAAAPSIVPRLDEVFLPAPLLDELCSVGGLLEGGIRACEDALSTAPTGLRH